MAFLNCRGQANAFIEVVGFYASGKLPNNRLLGDLSHGYVGDLLGNKIGQCDVWEVSRYKQTSETAGSRQRPC